MALWVTGSSGFVGIHLTAYLTSNNREFSCISRALGTEDVKFPERCDCVIHLAGRAHILKDLAKDPLKEFRAANCDYALHIAREAFSRGMKRFVYVSTIGVYGLSESANSIVEDSVLAPIEYYAQSKYEAEIKLRKLSELLNFQLVIVRPSLVYGGNAPGNIRRIFNLINHIPVIPIAERNNSRSFVYVDNLVHFLVLVCDHDAAIGQVYNIADDPISTRQMVRGFSKGMNKRRLMFGLQKTLAKWLFLLLGREKMYQQLFESLVLDMTKAEKELGWRQVIDTDTALFEAGQEFMRIQKTADLL